VALAEIAEDLQASHVQPFLVGIDRGRGEARDQTGVLDRDERLVVVLWLGDRMTSSLPAKERVELSGS
jgi:hypothetical protein